MRDWKYKVRQNKILGKNLNLGHYCFVVNIVYVGVVIPNGCKLVRNYKHQSTNAIIVIIGIPSI